MIDLTGFRLPAEWECQDRTWLTWPQNVETWYEGSMHACEEEFRVFVLTIATSQRVAIQVNDIETRDRVAQIIDNLENIEFYIHPTNDAWCRDYGPDFLLNKKEGLKLIVDWRFNSWGEKYPPFDKDDAITNLISESQNITSMELDFILEGGSYEVNGQGDLITTESCLLNPNRNPGYSKESIEGLLKTYLCVERIVWLKDGIVGDDTDGHVDDFCRFSPSGNILLAESVAGNENFNVLEENYWLLSKEFDEEKIVRVPMPKKRVTFQEEVLPASYLNFCVTNHKVIVPIFGDENDQVALDIIAREFSKHEVVGLRANHIVIGLGGFHCLSKHEPSLK